MTNHEQSNVILATSVEPGMARDLFGRTIDYLRLSITDRCNLRCAYCMPPEGVPWRPREEILRYEEIVRAVEAAASLGICKLRITGGEPLVRAGVVDLVRALVRVPGIAEVTMTTNGVLLARWARQLAEAGLRRVNVSLDTLRRERFAAITRFDKWNEVWRGIEAAQEAGLQPIKLNVVVMRGVNDDELADFVKLTLARPWHVRFIELMPVSNNAERLGERYVTVSEMRERLTALRPWEPATVEGNGPARYVRLLGARGTIGFISPLSESFCEQCNRLRLTADGHVHSCLLSDTEVDLAGALRAGAGLDELRAIFEEAIRRKPREHAEAPALVPCQRTMSAIGG
jgi:cyclic pyranopterin phosphate synthase